jgi:hypothetical protein
MSASTRYVMLICSLPHHGPLFAATRPPLSRIRLNQCVAQLEQTDRADHEIVARLLDWSRHTIDRKDADIVRDARSLIPCLSSPFARELVEWRLEFRSAVAALRRRQKGESRPPPSPDWGYGRWIPTISAHWTEPALGIGRVFPWIDEARTLLVKGASVELERLLLGVVWRDLERRSEGHEFDFEAVLLYCLRWEVVARWTRYTAEAATTRFDHLVRQGLADVDLGSIAA